MKVPAEFELYDQEDRAFRVRFDYDKGEAMWFDARAGVGSPGHDPSVWITEVNFGAGWELPEVYPQLDIAACEQEVMDRLGELQEAENAAYEDKER